jgi:hypothetical protein
MPVHLSQAQTSWMPEEAPVGMLKEVEKAPLGLVLKVARIGPVLESQWISYGGLLELGVHPVPYAVTTVPGGPEGGLREMLPWNRG